MVPLGAVGRAPLGLGWSVAAIYLDRSGTIDRNGDWAGIFFNRNSLALYAALALLVAVFIAVDARSIESASRRWTVVGVLVAFAIVDVRLIAGSDALTPVVALGVALAAVGSAWPAGTSSAERWTPTGWRPSSASSPSPSRPSVGRRGTHGSTTSAGAPT